MFQSASQLKEILQEAGEQKTISIKFNEFPNSETARCELFINFLEDKKSQSSLLMISDEDYQAIKTNNKDYSFSLSYTALGDKTNSSIDCLLQKELYLYVDVAHGITIPIKKMVKLDSISSKKNGDVYCGNKLHYSSFEVTHKESYIEFCFGAGVAIKLNEKNSKARIVCDIKGTLNQQIADLAFFIDLITKKTISIGTETISLKQIDKAFTNLKFYKDKLEYLKQIKTALDMTGNKTDLDLMILKSEDWRYLDVLVKAFIKKQPIEHNCSARKAPLNMKIGNISLLLLGQKQENSMGKYQLLNIFEHPPVIEVKNNKKEKTMASGFGFLEKDVFLKSTNIDYDVITNEIINKPSHNINHHLTNKLVLNLLLAYDESKSKKIELLNCAKKLSKWLYEESNDINFFLNYLQALKRNRTLSNKERNKLHNFIENSEKKTDMLLTGIYILLDDFAGAQLHYKKLSENEKNTFEKFPIYNLYLKPSS